MLPWRRCATYLGDGSYNTQEGIFLKPVFSITP